MKRIYVFVLLALSVLMEPLLGVGGGIFLLNAQVTRITVQGTVLDNENVPVIGASVLEAGSVSNGAITDADGHFTLTVASGASLDVSCIGYVTKRVQASENVTVILATDSEFLEESVVVGYGTQRVATITGSVSQVKTEKITTAPVQNTTHALAGQLPGLVSRQTSGLPGQDNASLNIRGFGSPLVIVDGIEGSLETIDPNQIESISILKDASGSIYGARAGNGVLLVTTKRGSNAKPTVTFNASYSLQSNTVITPSASSAQRAQLDNDLYINGGGTIDRAPYTAEEIELFKAGTDPEYVNADWYRASIRQFAPQQNHNLSISGGTDKIKYYGYFGYNRQETQFKFDGGNYDRFNFQVNFDAKVTSQINVGMNLQYMRDIKNYPSGGDLYQDGVNFWRDIIYGADPRYPLYLPDRSLLSYANIQNGSPLWAVDINKSGYHRTTRNNMKFTGFVEYNFKYVKGLKLKANILFTSNNSYLKWMHKRGEFYTYEIGVDQYVFARNSVAPSSLTESYGTDNNIVQQYSINYDREFNGHNISVLAMYESTLDKNTSFNTSIEGFDTTIIEEMMAGDEETAKNNSSSINYGRRSFIGRVDYNYKDKYMVEAIVRADASSRFAKGYRWGVFPSVSVGWNIAKEDFMLNADFVDNLKIRASFGESGYDAVASFNYLTGYKYNLLYTFGEDMYNGLVSTGLANELLTWEQMYIANIGVDFSFFDRKLYGEFDMFQRDRKGIPGYRYQSLPNTFGATLPQENLNAIQTRGFELRLGTSGSAGAFIYDVSANISYNRSIWTKYDQAPETDPDRIRLYVNEGKNVDRQVGYLTEGLFTSQEEIDNWGVTFDELNNNNETLAPGDIKFVDRNKDGVINWRDQTDIGKGSTPHWMLGINGNFSWKGFDLSLLFQGAWGYTTAISYDSNTSTYCELYYDQYHNPDPNALIARPNGAAPNSWVTDYYYKDTAYLRLKNAALGYSLPKRIVSKIGISKLRIYLAGTNLFTLSNVSKYGVDPEIGSSLGQTYPQQYTVSIGCNLVF